MSEYEINEMYGNTDCEYIGDKCDKCWNGRCDQNMNVKADSGQ